MTEPEPDGLALDGTALLDELHEAITRFVVVPGAEHADAVILWTAATHGQAAWEHATRLCATSPHKRCGKSRLLDIIEATCRRPLITVNISAAALARSIDEKDPPTLLLDEADTVFGKSLRGDEKAETLRGLINAGHQRNRPYVRWDPLTRSPENCPTFAMAALAGIGRLPDTITDRAVVVPMQRRAPGERVQKFRTRRDTPPLHDLRDRLQAWVRAHLDELREADPDLPVDDRDADNWAPLASIADLAGGDWPERARTAAKVLTGQADEADESLSLKLLADLRGLDWGDEGRLPTRVILGKLCDLDESPWAALGKPPRPLDPRGIARLLRDYGISAKTVRVGEATPRGYERADLEPAWERYRTPLPVGEVQQVQHRNTAGQPESGRCTVADTSATPKHEHASDQGRCTVAPVSHTPPGCAVCGQTMDPVLTDAGFTMPSTDPRYTVGRLVTLADLGIPLPVPVTRAIAAFTAAEALRMPAPLPPGEPARQAVRDLAARLARTAAESARPAFDLGDVSAVTEARAEEQRATDQQAVALELRDASALLLGQAVAEHAGELINAIQARHQAVVTDLVKRAKRLPPGASDVTALEQGGQHRADYLTARDAVAELSRLRDALRLVDDGTPPAPDDGLSFCSGWERTGKLAGSWLAPSGTTTHGPLGTLEFWLDAARVDGYRFWLPTAAEQAARLAELRADRQARRLQAAAR